MYANLNVHYIWRQSPQTDSLVWIIAYFGPLGRLCQIVGPLYDRAHWLTEMYKVLKGWFEKFSDLKVENANFSLPPKPEIALINYWIQYGDLLTVDIFIYKRRMVLWTLHCRLINLVLLKKDVLTSQANRQAEWKRC